MSLPIAYKMEHDVVGHYTRPDIFELKINNSESEKDLLHFYCSFGLFETELYYIIKTRPFSMN